MNDCSDLTILSIGYTRDLWNPLVEMQDDSLHRLGEYAARIKGYHVIVHFKKRDNPQGYKECGPKLFAYPTNAYNNIDSFFRMIALGIRLSRRIRFNLVQAQDSYFTGFAAFVLSRVLGIPLSVTIYGTNPFDPYWVREHWWNRLFAPLGRCILRNAQCVLADGSRTARNLAAAGIDSGRIALKPMIPFDIGEYFKAIPEDTLRRELCQGGRFDRIILFVGRIVAQKNLSLFIDVACDISVRHPRTRFVCVGDGPLRDVHNKEARIKGVGERFLWTGSLPRTDVFKYMTAADLFFLPSIYEGFPRVLMEAAAAGKPIVSADVSGSDDVIENGRTGYIVAINDRDGFTDRIAALLNDPSLCARMGAAGRERMRSIAAKYADPNLQVEIWRDAVRRDRRKKTQERSA